MKNIIDKLRAIYFALSFCALCIDTDSVIVIAVIVINFCLAGWQVSKVNFNY